MGLVGLKLLCDNLKSTVLLKKLILTSIIEYCR